jgi:hypothetical protein
VVDRRRKNEIASMGVDDGCSWPPSRSFGHMVAVVRV